MLIGSLSELVAAKYQIELILVIMEAGSESVPRVILNFSIYNVLALTASSILSVSYLVLRPCLQICLRCTHHSWLAPLWQLSGSRFVMLLLLQLRIPLLLWQPDLFSEQLQLFHWQQLSSTSF